MAAAVVAATATAELTPEMRRAAHLLEPWRVNPLQSLSPLS